MLRREFMMLVGGAASALPLGAVAQQARKWRIGFLHPGQSATVTNRIAAFREGLGASGLAAAADAEIVARIANGQLDQLPAMAADLVAQNVPAICGCSAILLSRTAFPPSITFRTSPRTAA
jgi:putative ABC transport system substrate-binding protein